MGSSWKREVWFYPGPFPSTATCLAIAWPLLVNPSFKSLDYRVQPTKPVPIGFPFINSQLINSQLVKSPLIKNKPIWSLAIKSPVIKTRLIKSPFCPSKGSQPVGATWLAAGNGSEPAWP